jgi:hypothetical protein
VAVRAWSAPGGTVPPAAFRRTTQLLYHIANVRGPKTLGTILRVGLAGGEGGVALAPCHGSAGGG